MKKELEVPELNLPETDPLSPYHDLVHNNAVAETVRTSFVFTKEDFLRIKMYAAKHGTTMTALFTAYIKSLPSE